MKTKFILLLAVIMGIATTALFYQYIKKIDNQVASNEELVRVVAASKPIKVNQLIDHDSLKYMNIPKSSVHPQAIIDKNMVEGLYATADLEKDEVILTHRVQLAQEEDKWLSRKVKTGYRAVSVGVNFVQSVSNLINPEDYVDVIVTKKVKVADREEWQSELLLENVRVLAIGRKMVTNKSGEEEVYEYSSVTLEILEDDVVAFIHAQESGSIQLSLRSRLIAVKGGEDSGQSK